MEHGIKIRVMKTVSEGARKIVLERVRDKHISEIFTDDRALALLHGDVCDLIYASDMAQKTSGVDVFEINGTCPQHMICVGILGDTAAVDAAVEKIKKEFR
ncbi:MAG: BMC domain-containing protein [Firmicutes bacterium]|nr:BMC domain-containing protein [Bacillota bacterium]